MRSGKLSPNIGKIMNNEFSGVNSLISTSNNWYLNLFWQHLHVSPRQFSHNENFLKMKKMDRDFIKYMVSFYQIIFLLSNWLSLIWGRKWDFDNYFLVLVKFKKYLQPNFVFCKTEVMKRNEEKYNNNIFFFLIRGYFLPQKNLYLVPLSWSCIVIYIFLIIIKPQ